MFWSYRISTLRSRLLIRLRVTQPASTTAIVAHHRLLSCVERICEVTRVQWERAGVRACSGADSLLSVHAIVQATTPGNAMTERALSTYHENLYISAVTRKLSLVFFLHDHLYFRHLYPLNLLHKEGV